MSQSSNHLRLVSWTWQLVNFTQMASTVTRSQSNRAPLGCGGTGDVQLRNLQQLCDTIMSIWTKISEECFQRLVESMLWRIKAVLKAKWVQLGTSKVYLIKWSVSVYVCVCMYSIYIYIFIQCTYKKKLYYIHWGSGIGKLMPLHCNDYCFSYSKDEITREIRNVSWTANQHIRMII